MTNYVTSILRTFAQILVGYLVTWLAARGLDVPENVRDWVLGAIVAGGILVWTAIVRWLETQQGDGSFAIAARRVARLLMLGIGSKQPAYVPPSTQIEAVNDELGTRTTNVS